MTPAKRVLVADDESVVRTLISRLLKSDQIDLTSCATVTDAIREIRSGDFDLVISDLRLPDGDGVQIVEAYRSVSAKGQVMVITGSLTPEEKIRRIHKMGAYDCLMKPFDVNELKMRVNRLLDDPKIPHSASGSPAPSENV
jgi:DNA-binding NtrC family response regulator